MVTIFGTTYYTIGTGLVVLALLAPLLFWLSRWLLRPNVEDEPRRVRLLAEGGLTLGLLLLAAAGLYWDVYLIGQRAKELCEETGLVVHASERSKSFIGSSDINFWSGLGFEFVEDTVGGRRFEFSLRNGSELRREVPEFRSRFELVIDAAKRDVASYARQLPVSAHIDKLVDRTDGRVIGSLTEYTIGWGWADRKMLQLTGFVATPRICGRDVNGRVVTSASRLGVTQLVTSTLIR